MISNKNRLTILAGKFKDFFDPETKEGANHRPTGITNQDIANHLKAQMEEEIVNKSVGGTMIFPMSFNILMHDSDFKAHRDEFALIIDPILDEFYKVLNEAHFRYPKCRPGATRWYFQFAGCDTIDKGDGNNPIPIIPGQIVSTASVCTLNLKEASNSTQEINTTVSLRPQNSNRNDKLNINREIFAGLNMVDDCTYAPVFDFSRVKDMEIDNGYVREINGYADISFSQGGVTTHYLMKDKLVTISGKGETRKGERSVLIINDERIKVQHLQIRRLDDGTFQVATYYMPVMLNSVPMELSQGAVVKWTSLVNNSHIFIANSIQLVFKIN